MKPCRKQNQNSRRPVASATQSAASPASAPGEAAVHRYVHPIRTVRPAVRSVEDLLGDVLAALVRQSEQLEEVLRRLERDNSDTM